MGNLFGGGKSSSVSLPAPEKINIDEVINKTKNQARDNAFSSRALEAELDPSLAKLRTQTSDEVYKNLNLGYELPSDVQQMIQRSGLQKGAGSGTSGSQFNRNLTARDLGLNSLQLYNNRLNQALGLTSSTPEPTAGLDPASVADLYVANTNTTNQYNAQKAAIQQQNANSKSSGLGSLFGGLLSLGTSIALAPTTGGGSLVGNLFK